MACQHLEQCNTAVTLRDVPDAADTGARYGTLATLGTKFQQLKRSIQKPS